MILNKVNSDQDQELGRVGEISNMFDVLPTLHNNMGNHNQP